MSLRSEYPIYLILFFAFAIRAVGITYGLPYLYHDDELLYVNPALRIIATGDLNPHWFHHPGSFVIYLFAILFAITLSLYYVYSLLRGHLYNLAEFKTLIRHNPVFYYDKNPFLFHFLGRILMLVFAVITIYLVYLLAKRIFNRQIALLGTFCLSICPIYVIFARSIRPDVPATMLILFSLYFLLRFTEGCKDVKWLILSSLFAGFSMAAKYTSGVVVFPILIQCFIGDLKRMRSSAAGYFSEFFKIRTNLSKALLFTAAGFFIFAPFFILDLRHSVPSLIDALNWKELGNDRLPGIQNYVWDFREAALKGFGGAFFAIFAFLGLCLVLLKRSSAKLMFFIFPVLYFLVIGAGKLKKLTWFIAIYPFEAILFGVGFYATYRFLMQSVSLRVSKVKIVLLFIVVAAIGSYPILKNDIEYAIKLTRVSTRTIAKDWIEGNLPGEAKIAYEKGTAHLHVKPKGKLRLMFVPEGIASHSLSYYRERSVEYIAISDSRKALIERYSKKFPRRLSVYKELDYETRLIKSISDNNRCGGTIRILKLEDVPTENNKYLRL